MKMKNIDVVESFLNHEPNNTSHLHSTGEKLISYSAVIAYWKDGKIIVNPYKYSNTTSRHTGYLKRLGANLISDETDDSYFAAQPGPGPDSGYPWYA